MTSNPLLHAVIENEIETVKEHLLSKWRFEKDENGFFPFEIARYLGRTEIEKILYPSKPKSIKVEFQNDKESHLVSIQTLEKRIGFTYRSFLTFQSYEDLKLVISNCPYFFRLQALFGKNDLWEEYYLNRVLEGFTEHATIKWIDDQIGYGVFADRMIPKNGFIGEYTGIVKELNVHDLNTNGYCLQYPKKFKSSHYFIVDAKENGNFTRFINHHDQPNLQPLWIYNKKLLHLVFIANQDIEKGEELTFNYGKDYWLNRQKLTF